MDLSVSLVVEVPESLHRSLKSFLDSRNEWDQDRTVAAALSLFLMQQGVKQTAHLFAEVPNAA